MERNDKAWKIYVCVTIARKMKNNNKGIKTSCPTIKLPCHADMQACTPSFNEQG